MSPSFKKNKEDFICGHCATAVVGNGYTNHCPHCLWSKHVDIVPGDRKEDCHGLMEPIRYEKIGDTERIVLQCQKCGFEKANKLSPEDNREELFSIARKIAERGY